MNGWKESLNADTNEESHMRYRGALGHLFDRIGQLLTTSLFPVSPSQVIDVGSSDARRKRSPRERNARTGWHVVPSRPDQHTESNR